MPWGAIRQPRKELEWLWQAGRVYEQASVADDPVYAGHFAEFGYEAGSFFDI